MTDEWGDDGYWSRLSSDAHAMQNRTVGGAHEQAVPADRYDLVAWRLARDELASLEEMVTEFGKEQDYVEAFFYDLFNLAMKGDPQVRSTWEMKATHLPNRAMAAHFKDLEEFTDLHQHTAGNLYGSAMALLSMQTEIEKAYERMAAARALADALQKALQAAQETAGAVVEAVEAGADEDTLAALLEAAQAATDAMDAAQEQAEGVAATVAAGASMGLRTAMRAAIKAADDDAARLAAFGLHDGSLQAMPFAERAALSQRLRGNRLAKYVDLIGTFREMARGESRRRITGVPSERAGVVLSDDLTRLLPTEYVSLTVPELEDDFWLRWAEHRLVTWELRGTERMGRGPIVIVCDESESMGRADLGGATREAWSKAFSLAVVDIARAQHRDVFYIGFSSPHQQWTTNLSAGVAGINGVIEFTEHFFNGGTWFDTPLTMALDLCQEYAGRQQDRPDILFITDDEFRVPSDEFIRHWHQVRGRLSLRCWGIHIGATATPSGALGLLADNVRSISALVHDVDSVSDIFRTL